MQSPFLLVIILETSFRINIELQWRRTLQQEDFYSTSYSETFNKWYYIRQAQLQLWIQLFKAYRTYISTGKMKHHFVLKNYLKVAVIEFILEYSLQLEPSLQPII
jgi:hypothetical protein